MANNGDSHEVESPFINVDSQPTSEEGKRKGWLDFITRGTGARKWILQNKALCGLIGLIGPIIGLIIFISFREAYFASQQSRKSEQSCMQSPLFCPDDSIKYRKKCFYISQEESNWNNSQKSCLSRNSSLARIENDEKDFVKGIMQNQPFWIGLHKSFDQSWKWLNGENATKPAGNGGDCAYLHGSEKVEANSGRCNIPHRYICKFEVP